jgi:hypothetical protein
MFFCGIAAYFEKGVKFMEFICCEELLKNTSENNFESDRYEGQDKIEVYLKNGREVCVSMELIKDVFTGESIGENLCFTDGTYMWESELAYYVEKYNLRLPKSFEQHIFQNFTEHIRQNVMRKLKKD